jgi:hypothetical protein
MEWRMIGGADIDKLWAPLVEHGVDWCAPNASADASWLAVSGVAWRVAVTRPARRNCYVVSATGQYLDYAREEIRRLPSAMQRVASSAAVGVLAPVLRRLDPIVVLDALPVSTVLHVPRTDVDWAAAVDAARQAYPGVPIIVRSLDSIGSGSTLDALSRIGMQLVPSRLVFHQDPRVDAFWHIRNVRHDLALARHAPLPVRELTSADTDRIAELYWLLYGHKHSLLNPHFSTAWLAHGIERGVLTGEGIVHDGHLAAAYLSYNVDDLMTNPVFGYDTALPQQLGLYRRLSLLTMQSARRAGLRIHASSGAPLFKSSRGGVAVMEYHAVDLRGVRGAQAAAWSLLLRVATAVGPSVFSKAE